ncbi:hypothetical protein TrVE_jg6901 [Triparma verrucosa]|uniref:Uncharacterized protein n=1 Tax=Triparma verrucosa TaxID=1606542 RepID=A0A9W7EPX8_9STRA|nr:hypothetical protein TrVE_jg6901 [Triparma verrucosa]
MFGSSTQSQSTHSRNQQQGHQPPAPSTPFSLRHPPSHTPLPKVLLDAPQNFTTICLLSSISSSKVSKTGKAYKELTISYPSLPSAPTLRLFGSAYSSSSNLKPGHILLLKDCKVDMLNGRHSLMTFKDTSVRTLGSETILKFCSCGWTGTGSCIKCLRKNIQNDKSVKVSEGNKALAAKKKQSGAKFQQMRGENNMTYYSAVKQPVVTVVKEKSDVLGALLKRTKTKQVSQLKSRTKGLINEGDRFDGSVLVPQSSKVAVQVVRSSKFKKTNPLDILEKQRQLKNIINLNRKHGPKNPSPAPPSSSSLSSFASLFGSGATASSLSTVRTLKSSNASSASDLALLAAKEKLQKLESSESSHLKKLEKSNKSVVKFWYKCDECMNTFVKVPFECRQLGHRIVKCKGIKDRDVEKKDNGGLVVGVGIEWNGTTVRGHTS